MKTGLAHLSHVPIIFKFRLEVSSRLSYKKTDLKDSLLTYVVNLVAILVVANKRTAAFRGLFHDMVVYLVIFVTATQMACSRIFHSATWNSVLELLGGLGKTV